MGTLASELLPIAVELNHAPRVYVDANLPLGAVHAMRQELGWDVLFVLEHDELRRAADLEHFRRARELGRTLITLDNDFFDEIRFPATESAGVIVCYAPDEAALIRLLKEVDRIIFRAAAAGPLPLAGQILTMPPGGIAP